MQTETNGTADVKEQGRGLLVIGRHAASAAGAILVIVIAIVVIVIVIVVIVCHFCQFYSSPRD